MSECYLHEKSGSQSATLLDHLVEPVGHQEVENQDKDCREHLQIQEKVEECTLTSSSSRMT